MEGLSSASSDPDRIAMSNGPCCVFGRRPPQPNDCRSMRMSRRQIDHFPPGSYSRRFNLSEIRCRQYLPPVCQINTDFGDRGDGKKMHLACDHFDYTCRIVATAFDASVDVTDAANGSKETCVDRSHRLRFAHLVAGCGVSDKTIDRSHKSDSGHAHLSYLNELHYVPKSRSILHRLLSATVIISTAQLGGRSNPRKSDCERLQSVEPALVYGKLLRDDEWIEPTVFHAQTLNGGLQGSKAGKQH